MKSGDQVRVLRGSNEGREGEVDQTFPGDSAVVVFPDGAVRAYPGEWLEEV